MRIGLVGGTGKEGRGLAVRWARAGHSVYVGSRDRARGEQRAHELSEQAGADIGGGDNQWVIAQADVVVVSVPYPAHRATLEGLRDALADSIVIDITVPLRPPKVREVHLPDGQAAALEAREVLGADAKLVAAMHHVSSVHLADTDYRIECDVLVCSDHDDARELAIGLVGDLGMRGLDAGPLRNAIALESLTPVLLYLNKRYKSSGTGLRITGIP